MKRSISKIWWRMRTVVLIFSIVAWSLINYALTTATLIPLVNAANAASDDLGKGKNSSVESAISDGTLQIFRQLLVRDDNDQSYGEAKDKVAVICIDWRKTRGVTSCGHPPYFAFE